MASWMAMLKGKRTNGDIPLRRTLPESSAGHDEQTPLHEVKPVLDPDFNINSSPITDRHFAWQSDPVDKLLLLCASILPLVASTYLLVRTVTDRRSTGPLLAFVSSN